MSIRGLASFTIGLVIFVPGISATGHAAVSKSSPATTMAEADTLYAHQSWAAAARAYEGVTRTAPENPRAWYRLGVCYASLSDWPRAIAADRRAETLGASPQFVLYNLSCACARGGQPDSAFAALERLMNTGYRQADVLKNDDDLASLRSDARFQGVLEKAERNVKPCAYAPESRQLDFWLGDWDCFSNVPGHPIVGHSHVELILGDCVVFENWTDRFGSSGKSFNGWNRELQCWQQNWMDDTGTVTNYGDGHFANGSLVYQATQLGADGKRDRIRMTFFDLGPGHVRQLGERSVDGGTTWTVQYDLDYVRHS